MAVIAPPICGIFLFSIFYPVVLGASAMKKHRDDVHIVALGVLSILIGIVIGIMNVLTTIEYYAYYTGWPLRMLYMTAMIELLFIPLMVLGGIRIKKEMAGDRNWRRSTVLLSVVLAAILVVTALGGSVITVGRGCEYRFNIDISTDGYGPYYLLLPVPLAENHDSAVVSDFVGRLHFVSGEGDFSVIETEYGPALRISSTYSATLEVRGQSQYRSFRHITLWNESHRGYGEQFLIFTNKSFVNPIVVDVEARESCACLGTDFSMSADISANGWGSYDGEFEEWVC